jgi:perosamine synthetase
MTLGDLLGGWRATDTEGLRSALLACTGAPHAGVAGTGTAAFFVILKALAARSGRSEVVLPAYTAPVVLLPVLRAGLRPVIADIDLATFQMDPADAARLTNDRTLAVMPAHMFGLPCDVGRLKEAMAGSGAAVVEDAASALGATLGGRMAGTFGDAGFYSFHRGKPTSSATGGAWVAHDDDLAEAIRHEAESLRRPGLAERTRRAAKIIALALAVRPWVYTLAHPLLARFKDTVPHPDFDASALTATQAGTVASQLKRLDRILAERRRRAERAREMLAEVEGVTLPAVLPGARPAFSHCPLMLPDTATRDRALAAALHIGLECTTLYNRTIHRAYALPPEAYGGGACPRAEALAARLMLIPCHPFAPMARIEQAAELVKAAIQQAR